MKTATATLKGEVTQILPNAHFRVKVTDVPSEILCYLCGKMTKKFIKPDIGDMVTLEVSPLDFSKGRIVSKNTTYKPPAPVFDNRSKFNKKR